MTENIFDFLVSMTPWSFLHMQRVSQNLNHNRKFFIFEDGCFGWIMKKGYRYKISCPCTLTKLLWFTKNIKWRPSKISEAQSRSKRLVRVLGRFYSFYRFICKHRNSQSKYGSISRRLSNSSRMQTDSEWICNTFGNKNGYTVMQLICRNRKHWFKIFKDFSLSIVCLTGCSCWN